MLGSGIGDQRAFTRSSTMNVILALTFWRVEQVPPWATPARLASLTIGMRDLHARGDKFGESLARRILRAWGGCWSFLGCFVGGLPRGFWGAIFDTVANHIRLIWCCTASGLLRAISFQGGLSDVPGSNGSAVGPQKLPSAKRQCKRLTILK